MKVRRAIIKDLKRVQDLYGIVSDEILCYNYFANCCYFCICKWNYIGV